MSSSPPIAATAQRPSNTKIVATVGPAVDAHEKLVALLRAGVDVFRLNAAHGDLDALRRRFEAIGKAAAAIDRPVGVLLDLAGPKMRVGEIAGGALNCALGAQVRFVRGEKTDAPQTLVTTYAPLIDELHPGARVLLVDGLVVLEVEHVRGDEAVCRVVQPGLVRNRQGINLPGLKLSAPPLDDDDRPKAAWAVRAGVDFLGLSFVRCGDDVRLLRTIIEENGGGPQIIAKIEKPEAVDCLDEIIAAADGVMVARGDLGVEADIARLPMLQKEVVAACHRACKPVIVATQMLDSMQHSRLPTRAEATDVANAILDGADACMLSGETAIGEYPVESVEMMHRIALATEPAVRARASFPEPRTAAADRLVTEAVAAAACDIADELNAKLVIVATASGRTALTISKNRSFVPTIGVSDCPATLRRMCLYWGVVPLPGARTATTAQLVEAIVARGRAGGWLQPQDRVVLVTGTGFAPDASAEDAVSQHNALSVHEVAP